MASISACLVVHNEAAVIERCLQSLQGLVDEIILVHDGPCTDDTLTIAKKYTDKIFIRDFIGEAEPHRVFSFSQANGEWIIQIDADEFFAIKDHQAIRAFTADPTKDAYYFSWELWNGRRPISFTGLNKICLFRKQAVQYVGVPHSAVTVAKERLGWTTVTLHHRPNYNNIAWRSFWKKMKRWAPVHARYYREDIVVECFQTTAADWHKQARVVVRKPVFSLIWLPFKNLLGQLRNGLWTSWYGWQTALQQYVYYVYLYWLVWHTNKKNV